ncbi:50S ribosomal protein L29 [Patescibacteria group bacterium]|nr:50S ribosomal protein L29 [Patescibacteria group bacterium]
MKKDIVGQKDKKELEKLLENEREKLRSFRFKLSQGKTKNVKGGMFIKRNIARILTRFRQAT